MTPTELDALAEAQAEIRAMFDAARATVATWDLPAGPPAE